MDMIKVKSIDENAQIGIYSPSEPISENRESRFHQGVIYLESLGFKVEIAKNALKLTNFTAGTIEDRISDINNLLSDDCTSALLASWGGKSCNQLIRYLDYELIKKARKPILGFSDVGVLLNSITAKTGLVTFYGPNVIGKLNETEHGDLSILKTENYTANLLGDTSKVSCKVLKEGIVEGHLVGGNLSTFVLGTVCSDIPDSYYNDAILFWEDAGNTAQIINQYLTAISNRGIFDRIKGMIIGDFLTEESQEWKRTDNFTSIMSLLNQYNIPVLYAPTFGHKKLENPIMPIGAKCKLNASECTLNLLSSIIES